MHKIIYGDCIQKLRNLPNESVDLVLPDPPYGNDESYCRDKRTIASDEHPLIEHTTARGDLVLDPFAGSGSTGVAAVQLGRDFIGIECAYKYVRVARARLADVQPVADDNACVRHAA